MTQQTIVLDEKRNVTLTCYLQPVGGKFEYVEKSPAMLILPGGGLGTENLDRSAQVDQWLRYADEHGIFVGAICAAPSILGKRGLLNGRKATAYPGCEPEGAVIDGSSVVQDGHYITAKGAGVCLEFALRLIACLRGEPAAQAVKDEIQCQR